MTQDLRDFIRTIPDFPHAGILFRDVTTLFGDAEGLRLTVDRIVEACHDIGIDKVAGLEARGFILGGAVAHQLGLGFVPVRKAGKLPGKTISEDYELEYGTAEIEIHRDAVTPGQRVLVVDDLLATGGTAAAAGRLLTGLGADIAGYGFLVELDFLSGRDRLDADIFSLLNYNS